MEGIFLGSFPFLSSMYFCAFFFLTHHALLLAALKVSAESSSLAFRFLDCHGLSNHFVRIMYWNYIL